MNSDIELKEIEENNEDKDKIIIQNAKWTREHESILIEWADKAMCYRWLHTKARSKFGRINTFITIPVIIMSTLTGTANFAQDKFPEEYRDYVPMAIGGINIIAGILTTIQQFLKISELNEAHRVASIAWDKFYRNTKVELAKSPDERLPVLQMIKIAKEEFDRLMETSPPISPDVIKKFKKTFSGGLNMDKLPNSLTQKQINYLDIKKPEICGNLESTSKILFKPKEKEITSPRKITMSAITLARKAIELKRKQERIEKIILFYLQTKKRQPTKQEIFDELDGEIAMNIVEQYVNDYNKERTNSKTSIKVSPQLNHTHNDNDNVNDNINDNVNNITIEKNYNNL